MPWIASRCDGGAAGNPVNPDGHTTAYLWQQVWQRDSLLEILGRYMVTERDDKKQIAKIISPRYHQLDATRRLLAAVLAEGAGFLLFSQKPVFNRPCRPCHRTS